MSNARNEDQVYNLLDSKTGLPVDMLSKTQRADLDDRLIQEWSWCTDDDEIKKIIYYWIGGGRIDNQKIDEPFFILSSTAPNRMITIWEDGNGSARLTKGDNQNYFDTPFDEKSISNRRGSVLEAFARIEFILDHLTLIEMGVYSDSGKPSFALRTVRSLNAQRKIKDLRSIERLRDIDFRAIERIRNLRNQMAHQYFVEEIDYNGIHFSRMSENGNQLTKSLNEDYKSVMRTLINVYYSEQKPVIKWLLSCIINRNTQK